MKKLFFFAAAALALASCSNDETVAQYQGETISFRPLVGNVTRAADQNVSTLQESGKGFFVTAIHKVDATTNTYFDNVQFTYDSGSSTYNSATKYYWPAAGTLDFFAYAPATGTQVTRTDYKTFGVTPSTTVAEQVDLIYANTDGKTKTGAYTPQSGSSGGSASTYGAAGVPLNFRHTGAKIVLKLKNLQPNLKLEVSGFKIVNVDGTATFTYNDAATSDAPAGDGDTDTKYGAQLLSGDWTNQTAAAEKTAAYSVTFDSYPNQIPASQTEAVWLNNAATTPIAVEANIVEALNMILIPQTTTKATVYSGATANSPVTSGTGGSYIAIRMVIKNNTTAGEVIADASQDDVSGHTKWAMWPVAFDWAPGKIYTYTIDLGDGGYWEINDTGDEKLDPVLENALIKFVDVSVDNWSASAVNVDPAPAP